MLAHCKWLISRMELLWVPLQNFEFADYCIINLNCTNTLCHFMNLAALLSCSEVCMQPGSDLYRHTLLFAKPRVLL